MFSGNVIIRACYIPDFFVDVYILAALLGFFIFGF